MERFLDRRLMLLTKLKLGDDYKWILPTSQVEPSESLIQAAKRTVDHCLGSNSSLQLTFLSSAPTAVYSYVYPKRMRSDGKKGVRMFILKSFVKSGTLEESSVNKDLVKDYCWLNRDEVKELMLREKQGELWKSLNSSLLHESMSEDTIKKILSDVRRNVTKQDTDVRIEIKKQN